MSAYGEAGVTVLSAMITPAVLISACGTLILSTSNRLGRAVDQVRRLTDRFRTLADGGVTGAYAEEERDLIAWQIPRLSRRAHLLQRSLTAFYLAVGLFVLASVVIGGSVLGGFTHELTAWERFVAAQVPVVLGLGGAAVLSYGSLLLIVEARLALETTTRETRFLHELVSRYGSTRPAHERDEP